MTNAQHNAILKHWFARAENANLKPGTVTYAKAQAHFLCGAMAALNVVNGEKLDAGWTISLMCGRPIEYRHEEATA